MATRSTGGTRVQIEVEVDASKAISGFDAVKASGADAADSLNKSGEKARKSLDGLGAGAAPSARAFTDAEQKIADSLERTTARLQAGGVATEAYQRLRLQQRGIDPAIFKEQLDALAAVEARQRSVNAAVQAAGPVFNQYGLSAKQTSAALRQVPAQLTDIVVSLQGGQAPLTVLLQQGGQLKDVFGGVVPAAKALGSAILGLVNPYTVAAAALGTLAFAYFRATQEQTNFQNALILTGNASGTTVGQLNSAAASIAKFTGVTQGAAAGALTEFAKSGIAAGAQIEKFAASAVLLQREAGVAVEETVKQFAALGKEPVSASLKLNETTRFLTISVYEQIRSLEEQGRTAEAAAVAQNAYADAINSRTSQIAENLGIFERGWRAVKEAVSGAADEALRYLGSIGRRQTPAEELAALNAQQNERGTRFSRPIPLSPEQLDRKRLLEAAQAADEVLAAEKVAQDKQLANRARYNDLLKQNASTEKKLALEIAAARKVATDAFSNDAAAGLKAANDIEAAIRARQPGRSARAPRERVDNSIAQNAAAVLKLNIDTIKDDLQAQTQAYATADRILEAQRSAGLVSETAYYEAKRQLVIADTNAKVDAANKEAARLRQENLSGKEAIDNLAKIQDAQAKAIQAQKAGDTALALSSIQQEASLGNVERAYVQARQAAQDYLDTARRGFARDLAGVTLSDSERKRLAGRNQIEDKYQAQRQQAENTFVLSRDQSAESRAIFQKQLALIEEFQTAALKDWEEYYDGIQRAESDWATGAQRAVNQYLDDIDKSANQSEKFFTDAFKGAEDALTTFVTTGKLSFSSLADSILQDLARIAIQQSITGPLAKSLFSDGGGGDPFTAIIGAILGSPGRASGGPVDSGGLYQVNERGPELLSVAGKQYLMMGNQSGNVTPNSAIGGKTVNVTVNQTFGPNTSRQTTSQAAADARRQLEAGARNL